MTNRFGRMGWMFAATLCAAVLACGSTARAGEPKDLLKLVPDDAWGFMMIRSLDTIDQRATHLQQLLNLPIPGQVTPMAMMMLNIQPGADNPIDMKNPLCIVMMDVQKFGTVEGMPFPDPGSAAVVIAPFKDSDALMKAFGAEEAKEGVSKCNIMGNDVFAAVKSGHVIMGKNKDCVIRVMKSSKSAGDNFASARAKVIADSDVYFSAAMGSLVRAYNDVISGYMQGMAAVMGPQAKDLENLRLMLSQMKAFDVALTIGKDGVALRYLMEADADSDLDKMLKDSKTSSESLLAVLPKEKYLLAMGGMSNYSDAAMKFGNTNIIGSMLSGLQAEGFDEKAVKVIDDELLKILKNLTQLSLSVSALGEGSGGMFGLTVVIESKDADGFMSGVRKIWENAWKIQPEGEMADVKEHFVHKSDAESVGDSKVDTITLKVKELADKEQMDEDDMKTFETIMGKEVVFRFGKVSSKHIVCTFGGGKARHEKAMKAVSAGKADSLASDKGITEQSGNLPSPRSAEIYIAVDNILGVVKSVAKVMGEEEEIPFEVTPIDAPLSISTTQEGSVQRGDLYLPTKLIVAVKKMIDDAMSRSAMSDFDDEDDTEGDDEMEDEGDDSDEDE